MNIKLVLKVLGRVELVVAASMALPLACALLYGCLLYTSPSPRD